MACACNKNRPQPRGMGANTPPPESSTPTARTAPATSPSAAGMDASPAMEGTTQSFALRTREGQVERYGSSLEARAERIRRGGTLLP